MNRLHALHSSVFPRILSIVALCLLLPAAASAQIVLPPDEDPDPYPGPFCLTRSTTSLPVPSIVAQQGPMLDSVNWTRNGSTFFVTVKLRQEHRYAGSGESCAYQDGLWTSYGSSINVSSATQQMILRTTPTTTVAAVSIIAMDYPTRFAFNVRYQENVGAFSANFFPKRKKKVCVHLPIPNPNEQEESGIAAVRSCLQ